MPPYCAIEIFWLFCALLLRSIEGLFKAKQICNKFFFFLTISQVGLKWQPLKLCFTANQVHPKQSYFGNHCLDSNPSDLQVCIHDNIMGCSSGQIAHMLQHSNIQPKTTYPRRQNNFHNIQKLLGIIFFMLKAAPSILLS